MIFLDGLIYTLGSIIALLLVTGGTHFSTPTMKLELSEVDAFAWALFAALAVRRLLSERWLPRPLERAWTSALGTLGRSPRASLAWGCGLYVALSFWNSVRRYDSFHANAFDLGYVDQALWASAHGTFLHSTLSRGQTYLGEHFSPILGLVGQIYRVTDSVYAVFLIQCLVLASGAPLVYALGRRMKLPTGQAALIALCLLAYQPLRLANGFDFREDNLFVPIFLGALLALESASWPLFWGMVALSWTVKESAPVFTLLMGCWLFLEGRERRRLGAALVALSAAAFLVINLEITPLFVGTGSEARTMLSRRLGQFGATNAEIFQYALTHPLTFAFEAGRPFFQLKAVRYFFNVTTPFLWFARAAPLPALVAAAGIALNLVVNQPTIGFHYECVLIPFLFYVLARGLSLRQGKAVPVLVALSFLLFFGRSPVESIRRYSPTSHDRLVAAELAQIPSDVSVATQSALFAHVDHRMNVVLYSSAAPPSELVVVDLAPERDRYATPNLEADIAAISQKKYYTVLYDLDFLKIWRRK